MIVLHQACPEPVEGTADHILDLGPGGGVRGGEIVAEGTPEKVAGGEGSFTGHYLKPMLERAQLEPAEAKTKKQREAAG